MKKFTPDKILALLYLSASVFGLTLLICGSIVWGYWEKTLNTCVDVNCGCILFGMWTFNTFFGGKIVMCRYFALSPLPVVVWSILMYVFHTCFHPTKSKPEIVDVVLRGQVLLQDPSSRVRKNCKKSVKRRLYLPSAAAIISIMLIFPSCVILTYGYEITCKEYKKAVIAQIAATGNMAELVYDRISCGTVYDFMDYLLPDPPSLPVQYRRGSWIINSGLLLKISLICDWIVFIVYTFITCINISLCVTGKLLFYK